MAKTKAAPKKQKSMEKTLWDSANKLRGTVEPSEYKHVVLGLIFLKFASDSAALKSLTLSKGTLKPSFTKDTAAYSVKQVWWNNESSVTVTATAENAKATIKIGDKTGQSGEGIAVGLSVGANTVKVLVTAEDGKTTREYTVSVNRMLINLPEMANIPGTAGYDMGDASWSGPQETVHTVPLSPFRIAKYEVSYELWHGVRTWETSNGYTFANPGREGHDQVTPGDPPSAAKLEPVTTVSWWDSIAWCDFLKIKT